VAKGYRSAGPTAAQGQALGPYHDLGPNRAKQGDSFEISMRYLPILERRLCISSGFIVGMLVTY
jgi:hypothetical protein